MLRKISTSNQMFISEAWDEFTVFVFANLEISRVKQRRFLNLKNLQG